MRSLYVSPSRSPASTPNHGLLFAFEMRAICSEVSA